MNHYQTYLEALAEAYRDGGTEHTGRTALENLLKVVTAEAGSGYHVQHEPIRDRESGAPDFKVKKKGRILGYVEVKKIGANLDEVLKSEQIARYKLLSGNIVLTDYLQFVWLKDGKVNGRESLAYPSDLEGRRSSASPAEAEAVAKLLRGFFSTPPEEIGRAQDLALALATRCRLLRDYLGQELVRQQRESTGGRLFGLYQAFRDQVFAELTLAEFADAFAQTLGYGLFLTKFNAEGATIDLHNVEKFVPRSFELIRELVDFLDALERPEYDEVRWVVDEIVSLINGLDLAALQEDLSFAHRKVRRGVRARSEEEARLFERDPYIYFYEDFLQRYDPAARESRGVYYTPPPVVNFIVRAIDDILRDTFEIAEGLADHGRVTVLDFACGTGTFLVEVFERVFDTLGPDSGKRDLIVADHLLKNVFGFEYLIAPYTIAHLKLSQYLMDKERALNEGERLRVYLTNTLEPIETSPPQHVLDFLPALADEAKQAQATKRQPILVITGNPPYSGHSRNPSERMVLEVVRSRMVRGKNVKLKRPVERRNLEKTFIGKLIEDYKIVDGRKLEEKNPKWIHDDYVKFIRFAQWKMAQVAEGVIGVITNHSFLSNPTFRGMRQSLLVNFDQIYVFDLHGSSNPPEVAPGGAHNENVFDIQKGVAISLMIKNASAPKGIWHADLWGTQLEKYEALARGTMKAVDWALLEPLEPFYLFVPQDRTRWGAYSLGWRLTDMFVVDVLGFQTHRDHFSLSFDEESMKRRIADLASLGAEDAELRQKYALKDNRDWKLSRARARLRAGRRAETLDSCTYRPFDTRVCLFGHELMDYPRRELLDNVFNKENLTLLASRQVSTEEWRHAFVADKVAESCVVSLHTKEQNHVFPLYLYRSSDGSGRARRDLFLADPFEGNDRVENLAPAFRQWLDERYTHHFSPEQVLGYIYAVLHAPTYRERYREFLRIDFPRVPFPEERADFEALSALGWDLVQKHLLHEVPQIGVGRYRREGKGETHEVEKPRYSEVEERLWINKSQFFAPVPKPVWEFHIGGYQVLAKYLKDRKGRTLSLAEIENVEKVANVLAFTIEQMERIDAAYQAAFPEMEDAGVETAK